MPISERLKHKLLALTHSKLIVNMQLIQNVWGGYGQLYRITLSGGKINSVVIKLVNMPQPNEHPKGWNSDQSHQRKLFSYQVESYWYNHYVDFHRHTHCHLPRCLLSEKNDKQQLLVLEDLRECGFPVLKSSCSLAEAKVCIRWLAQFHILHLQRKPQGLWPTGSYWHLATRPDELAILQDKPLKKAASELDKRLSENPFQTLIHGDAKLANFCFSEDNQEVAAVDFQYVGAGCGMKDVILFISSAVKPEHCAQQAPILVNYYFEVLKKMALHSTFDGDQLELAWRPLYSITWADFQRFIKGWSPDHWKINSYSELLTQQALEELDALFSEAE
jgi:thiamine kinase-like enzyme